MLWFFLALLAPILWAISNVIDGELMRHRVKDARVMLVTVGLFSWLPALAIILSGHLALPAWPIVLFGLATGVVSLWAFYPYFRALETAHPVSAVLLWNLSPVLVAASAFVLLGERLDLPRYTAIAFLITSAILANLAALPSSTRKGARRHDVLAWMFLASIMTAGQALMEKGLFERTSPASGLALIALGSFTSSACLLFTPKVRRAFRQNFKTHRVLLSTNEGINLTAAVVASLSISLGPVSLVKALEGVQALAVLAFAWIAMKLFPRTKFHLSEAPPLPMILIATAFAVAGLWLIKG